MFARGSDITDADSLSNRGGIRSWPQDLRYSFLTETSPLVLYLWIGNRNQMYHPNNGF